MKISMYHLPVFFALAVLLSCNSSDNKDRIITEENASDNYEELEENIDEQVPERDTIIWDEISKAKTFPQGLSIGEYFASNEYEFYFGKDSVVVLKWMRGWPDFSIGKWARIGDTIDLKFNKEYQLKGVGAPLEYLEEGYAGNYREEYSSYDTIVVSSDESMQLSIRKIKKYLSGDAKTNPYEILDYYEGLDLSAFTKAIEKHEK